MRLRSYFHRGRHRAAAGRPTVMQIASRDGHMTATLPSGEFVDLGGYFADRVTPSGEFIERVHLPVEHGGIWLQPWPDADRRVP